MGKLLRLVLLGIAIWIAFRAMQRWLTARSTRWQRRGTGRVRMLRCTRCGVYVPETEAILHGDKPYCSAAHLPPGV